MITGRINGNDDKARYVLKKALDTEKNMAELKKAIQSYQKTQEKLRGKRLAVALALKGFSDTETPNTKQALISSAEALVDMEEYRKYMHDRIDTKVIEPMKIYKSICNSLREDVKHRDTAISKEQKKQLEFDRVTIKDSGNRNKISKSQMELENASHDLNYISNAFADHVEKFQSKKTQDIQSLLYELVYSEMEYHGKSLEILSNLQSSIFSLDMESDIYEIRDKLRTQESPAVKKSTDVNLY